MDQYVIHQDFLDSVFGWLVTDNRLFTVKYRLFTNQMTPSAQWDLAALVPPTYDGYVDSVALNLLGQPGINDAGDAYQQLQGYTFQPTGSTNQSTIRGYAIYSDPATGPDLPIALYLFDPPKVMASPNDVLIVQGRIMLGGPKEPMLQL